jgi:hypothetical protein
VFDRLIQGGLKKFQCKGGEAGNSVRGTPEFPAARGISGRGCVFGTFQGVCVMKIKMLLIVALAVCLSSSMALAVTIATPTYSEAWLGTIVSNMTSQTITTAQLAALTPLEFLPSGAYEVTNLARQAGFDPQRLGYYTDLWNGTTGGITRTDLFASVSTSTNTIVSKPFFVGSSFGFFEYTNTAGYKFTEKVLNNPPTTPSQSNGFIFDLSQLNITGLKGYIIAFEDGDGLQTTLGDKDYNDLVARVNAVPLPGALLLLGAGMARLVAYARRRQDS